MVLNIPDGYYEAAFTHSLQSSLRPAVCTLGVEYDGTTLSLDAQALLVAWGTFICPVMADVWSLTRMTLRTEEGTAFDAGTFYPGGTSHPPTTANVAFLVKKATAGVGRRNRGRLYLPGVSEQDVDAVGHVVGSKITEINAALTSFLGAMTTYHWSPALLHNGETFPPTFVTSLTCDAMAATQRDRMRR